MNIDITPRNDKGQAHGLWEYYYKDQLVYKCVYINDKANGVNESYWEGKLKFKKYYL